MLFIKKVLKSNEPPPENRSPTGQIGPYWLYLFVSAGDRLQLAEVFCSFTFPLLGQRLFYGKLFTPT